MSTRRLRTLTLVALAVSIGAGLALTTRDASERSDPAHATAPVTVQPGAPAFVQAPLGVESADLARTPPTASAINSAAPLVRVHAPPAVRVGDSFDAVIHIDSRSPVNEVVLTVTYDRKRLALASVGEGELVTGGSVRGRLSRDEPSDGNVQLGFAYANGAKVAGTGSIAVLRFEAMRAGPTVVAAEGVQLRPTDEPAAGARTIASHATTIAVGE